ncbi:hypothetical protein [Amycolatopsis magusensis]|uniref:CheY-specific phosphatase CheX n=1 Tax=Amycolatopsis magusensis TaxID=882444 RepID=A0ABS4PTV9_9PSEU|nr:hypothetical protein [Amycolatopsis magusensis]MBP2182866.1 CheY-specific phosphatase CheX [Amycolatopsis magusensis]
MNRPPEDGRPAGPVTAAVIEAMSAVNDHLLTVAASMSAGELPAAAQHEVANLLAELANLLADHATSALDASLDTPPSR